MEMLRRHLWVIDLAGIALGAVVSGQAAASLDGVGAATAHKRPTPRTAPPRPESDQRREASDRRHRRTATSSARRAAMLRLPPPVAQSTRALTLLAVMFAPPPADRRWSVAIIRNDAAATVGPYTVGARLGDATIGAIDEVRVTLDVDGGRREFLELLRGRRAGRGPRRPSTSSAPTATGSHARRWMDSWPAGRPRSGRASCRSCATASRSASACTASADHSPRSASKTATCCWR